MSDPAVVNGAESKRQAILLNRAFEDIVADGFDGRASAIEDSSAGEFLAGQNGRK